MKATKKGVSKSPESPASLYEKLVYGDESGESGELEHRF